MLGGRPGCQAPAKVGEVAPASLFLGELRATATLYGGHGQGPAHQVQPPPTL
jgi:hypothetical protein